MLYQTLSKTIVFLIAIFMLSCSSTDSIITNDGKADTTAVQTETTEEVTQTNVVPSLNEAKNKDEAKKKSAESQKTESDANQLPSKANKDERVAQVKGIMESKKNAQKKYDKKHDKKQRGKNPNAFYRYKREKAITRALVDDGVHDPAADLQDLQQPVYALKQFPEATFGNGVNWVTALNNHKINPRANQDGSAEQFTLDMNIPMDVPGTMNNVLFPHKAHTAWLACSNCHTGIFQMQRGANPITMKKINNGEYCGVCHGKVAFPIADCNRCHSVKKQAKNKVK
jgi:c(7)-type cytochrome triheme protein